MGRRGDAYDNAVAESFFASLETELLARTGFATRNQARSAVFDYIEGFYNPHRRHSSHRIPLTHRLRKESPTTLWITNREVSEKAGQLQAGQRFTVHLGVGCFHYMGGVGAGGGVRGLDTLILKVPCC